MNSDDEVGLGTLEAVWIAQDAFFADPTPANWKAFDIAVFCSMIAPNFRDPWHCPGITLGCHGGEWFEFDHFCDAMNVKPGEEPQAFAAWLGGKTGWDGEYGPVEATP